MSFIGIEKIRDIAALFTDYDGTIAPIDVARELSKPPKAVYEKLSELGRYIPIAVISTKDCDFLVTRTDFANAWACTYGLEIRVGNSRYVHEELPKWQEEFRSLIDLINSISEMRNVYIEIKHVDRLIGGLSIDWRAKGSINRNIIDVIVSTAEKLGLKVIRYRGHPFIDIYPGIPIDKGYAVTRLRELMGIRGPVVYLGDSENDISAMKVVEYPIGIRHRYNEGLELPVLFWVNEDELPNFLDFLKSKVHKLPKPN
ncbi:MAG: trehalose-phosphatase [Vulcanisaeta sp.]